MNPLFGFSLGWSLVQILSRWVGLSYYNSLFQIQGMYLAY